MIFTLKKALIDKRQLLGVYIIALCLPGGWIEAQSISDVSAAPSVGLPWNLEPDEVDRGIERALDYLASKQRADGAIADRQYDTTMTSLALMAFASVGLTPNQPGPDGEVARRALDFVIRNDRVDKEGYYGNPDSSRMYGHGITTLMLTELQGMGADEPQNATTLQRCRQALDLILSAQQQSKPGQYRGGWRYTPNSNDSDLSVSVWQLMALRSAKNDGLAVPASAITEALAYLKRSYTSPLNSRGEPVESVAGFSYLPENRNPTFAMTAAGLLAMQVCGEYESPLVHGAVRWLEENPPKWNERFFYYGTYYYAQGMHQRGGEQAEKAEQLVRNVLLDRQEPDGAWSAPGGEEASAGKVYTTSLAVLSLSVKYHYLPIYQR
ncbi:MAG: prenyltransferase [Planctomycetales bacterium]|nr:prenyltransferase [Planctomycetales bacterium]